MDTLACRLLVGDADKRDLHASCSILEHASVIVGTHAVVVRMMPHAFGHVHGHVEFRNDLVDNRIGELAGDLLIERLVAHEKGANKSIASTDTAFVIG